MEIGARTKDTDREMARWTMEELFSIGFLAVAGLMWEGRLRECAGAGVWSSDGGCGL